MDKNEKDLKSIIDDIQLTPEQGEAVNSYLAKYLNEWKTKIEEKVFNDINKQLLEEYNAKAKKFEKSLRASLTEELNESLEKEIKEKLTAEFKEQYEKDLNEGIEALNEYYELKFESFCQEAAKEIEETLKEDRDASPEAKAFNDILGTLQPFIDLSDNIRQIEILDRQDKTIKALSEKYNHLNKEKTIAELVVLLPEEHQENMRELLEECDTAEEVVDKFERACKFIKNTAEILESSEIDQGNDYDITDEVNDDDNDDDDSLIIDDDEGSLSEDKDYFNEDLDTQEDDSDDQVTVEEDVIEKDYFDDELETTTDSSINEEEEVITKNEGEANSKKLTESQLKIKHLFEDVR